MHSGKKPLEFFVHVAEPWLRENCHNWGKLYEFSVLYIVEEEEKKQICSSNKYLGQIEGSNKGISTCFLSPEGRDGPDELTYILE